MNEFAFTADRASAEPVYRQLVGYFEDLIDSRRLLPGERLPPTRELASALGLGRNTVALAYEILEASARVSSHVGRGTFVSTGADEAGTTAGAASHPRAAVPQPDRPFAWNGLFAARTQGLLPLPPPGVPMPTFEFDCRGGKVDPASVPVFELQRAYARALQRHLKTQSNHFDPYGYVPLREEIARSLVARGIRCEAGDVLIVNGAQQGLDLVARALIDPGDAVAVESPCYFGAVLAFRGAQAHLLPVAVDDAGMRVDDLLRLARTRRIKLIYATPAVQMPTGAAMSEPRRRALLELADREQIPILEDDYDGEFRGEGPIIPALKTADAAGQVIYVGTLTKALFPGLRLGYVVAAPQLLDRLARVRFAANFQPALLDQIAAAEFIKCGDFGRHLRRLRKRHTQKREALLRALEEFMPEGTAWNRPAAGTTLWITLPAGVGLDALARLTESRGLAFGRGDLFRLGSGEPQGIGISFGALTAAQIRSAAAILGGALRELAGAAREDADYPTPIGRRRPAVARRAHAPASHKRPTPLKERT